MLWKRCCQAALSLTLSCDNPSSVIHKLPLFWAGKDIKAALTQPVSLSSQDEKVGDGSSTTSCQEFGGKKKMNNLLHNSNIYAFKWIQCMRWHDSVKTVLDILHLEINSIPSFYIQWFQCILLSWLSIMLIHKIFLFVLFCFTVNVS